MMDIQIRRARAMDALLLTSILMGAKKYRTDIEGYMGEGIKELITREYIEKHIVFVAEKQTTIIGYCVLRKVEEDYEKNQLLIKAGYWLDDLFIRPAYVGLGIEGMFIDQMRAYCRENKINVFNVLSQAKNSIFYTKLGGTLTEEVYSSEQHKKWAFIQFKEDQKEVKVEIEQESLVEAPILENTKIKNRYVQFANATLEQRFFELDQDACEDELYDEGVLYDEDELYNEEILDERDIVRDKEILDGEDIVCDKGILNGGDIIYDKEALDGEDIVYDKETLDGGDIIYDKETLDGKDMIYDKETLDEGDIVCDKGILDEGDIIYDKEAVDEQDTVCDKEILDREDRIYDKGIIDRDNVVYHKEIVYNEDALDDENKLPAKAQIVSENMIQMEEQLSSEKELEDKPISRISYEEFVKANVPIGYKFECEEMRLQKEFGQAVNYEQVIQSIGDDGRIAESALAYNFGDEAAMDYMKQLAQKQIEVDDKALYIPWGEERVRDRKRAKTLLRELNNTDPDDRRLTHTILEKLFGRIGDFIHIEPQFKCSYGYNIEVGENFYAGYNCIILDEGKVRIGDHCVISPQVGIYTLGYPLDAKKRFAGYEYAKDVTIGNCVWIGGGSIINPGVTIGDNVVISPGSVIHFDIPDNVLVAGNPARIIKVIGA